MDAQCLRTAGRVDRRLETIGLQLERNRLAMTQLQQVLDVGCSFNWSEHNDDET